MTDDSRLAATAHVLRRTTFGPFPGQVDAAVRTSSSTHDLIASLLSAEPLPFIPFVEGTDLPNGGLIDIDATTTDDPREYRQDRNWWANRMRSDDCGLHEKMMWFWHTLFTTSISKVDDNHLCWRQLRSFHALALGNFGEMVKAMTLDGAMLRYLDGSESVGTAPNENYARELMELFTLGFGTFEQSDVRAAAKAFSGWVVDIKQKVVFHPERAFDGEVTIFGRTGRFGPDDVADLILARPECAPYIVSKLWSYLIGGRPDGALLTVWADAFRASGYEIAPLVASMLYSDQFARSVHSRARTPIEWHSAAVRSAGINIRGVEGLLELGQVPYLPPSPAGWPGDETWLSPTQAHARVSFLSRYDFAAVADLLDSPDVVDAVLERCSLYSPSDGTRATLSGLARALDEDRTVDEATRVATVLAAALLSPDFALA